MINNLLYLSSGYIKSNKLVIRSNSIIPDNLISDIEINLDADNIISITLPDINNDNNNITIYNNSNKIKNIKSNKIFVNYSKK